MINKVCKGVLLALIAPSAWANIQIFTQGDNATLEQYVENAHYSSNYEHGNVATLPLDTHWQPVAYADLNGDFVEDVIWQNSDTNSYYIYLSQIHAYDLGFSDKFALATIPDSAWQIVGTGDFDGNGFDDILWRHQLTGAMAQYRFKAMETEHQANYDVVVNGTIADLNYQVAGVADIDGNGSDDIIWRHHTTGKNYAHLYDKGQRSKVQYINTVADPDWHLKQVADLNGDGTADLIWHHQNTGQVFQYQMNTDGLIQQVRYITSLPATQWQLTDTFTPNGDGQNVLFWYNTQDHTTRYFNAASPESYTDSIEVVAEGHTAIRPPVWVSNQHNVQRHLGQSLSSCIHQTDMLIRDKWEGQALHTEYPIDQTALICNWPENDLSALTPDALQHLKQRYPYWSDISLQVQLGKMSGVCDALQQGDSTFDNIHVDHNVCDYQPYIAQLFDTNPSLVNCLAKGPGLANALQPIDQLTCAELDSAAGLGSLQINSLTVGVVRADLNDWMNTLNHEGYTLQGLQIDSIDGNPTLDNWPILPELTHATLGGVHMNQSVSFAASPKLQSLTFSLGSTLEATASLQDLPDDLSLNVFSVEGDIDAFIAASDISADQLNNDLEISQCFWIAAHPEKAASQWAQTLIQSCAAQTDLGYFYTVADSALANCVEQNTAFDGSLASIQQLNCNNYSASLDGLHLLSNLTHYSNQYNDRIHIGAQNIAAFKRLKSVSVHQFADMIQTGYNTGSPFLAALENASFESLEIRVATQIISSIATFPELKTLRLGDADFDYSLSWANLPNLETLAFSFHDSWMLPGVVFTGLDKLKVIDLSQTNTESIQMLTASTMPALQQVKLPKNASCTNIATLTAQYPDILISNSDVCVNAVNWLDIVTDPVLHDCLDSTQVPATVTELTCDGAFETLNGLAQFTNLKTLVLSNGSINTPYVQLPASLTKLVMENVELLDPADDFIENLLSQLPNLQESQLPEL